MAMTDADEVRALYASLLDAWNGKDAGAFAASFADDGEVIGFDGSLMAGSAAIEAELSRVFEDHPTGRYVGIVREVAPLSEDVLVLRAVAGVVPAGSAELRPELNSVQRLVAGRRDGEWRIALYQNTPAQFHGRPELVERLTEELRSAAEAAPGSG